jgi:hypothetical protein
MDQIYSLNTVADYPMAAYKLRSDISCPLSAHGVYWKKLNNLECGSTADIALKGQSLRFFAFRGKQEDINMKVCTFCSNESPMVFSHLTHYVGQLCFECYLSIQGSCSVCSSPLVPLEIKPDVNYQVPVKFINMGEKSILVCDPCQAAILQEFPQMFGKG